MMKYRDKCDSYTSLILVVSVTKHWLMPSLVSHRRTIYNMHFLKVIYVEVTSVGELPLDVSCCH